MRWMGKRHITFDLGTKFDGYQLPRPHAKTMAHIVPSDNEILALIVYTTNDNMGVGMASVKMIDGDPVEPCSEIIFSFC